MDAHVAPSALHLLTRLKHLEVLAVDLQHCHSLTTNELESALCLLIQESRVLTLVLVRTNLDWQDAGACESSIIEQLFQWNSLKAVVRITSARGHPHWRAMDS